MYVQYYKAVYKNSESYSLYCVYSKIKLVKHPPKGAFIVHIIQ